MAKVFRLACSFDAYRTNPDKTVRPLKPNWLRDANRYNATKNQVHSFKYWTKIYWATPPWITETMIAEMRHIYTSVSGGQHVDHIVPLSSPLVCGLHVPWNLQRVGAKRNLLKSNHWWPSHPFENLDLFDTEYQYGLL